MKLLSKYLPHGLFLENGLFRFTQPASLNDADDARPVVLFNEYAQEDLIAAAETASRGGINPQDEDELKAFFLNSFPSGRFDEKSLPGLWPTCEPRLRAAPFASIAELDNAVAVRAVELCLELANKTILVFSLSLAVASESMWAYYGNNHEGIEVRFHRDHPFFSDRLFKIDYSDEPVRVSSNGGQVRLCGQTVSTEMILSGRPPTLPLELLHRKRKNWGPEEEMRLLRRPEEATAVSEKKDSKGNDVFLFEVPSDAVDSIVLGYNASEDFVQSVLNKAGSSSRWAGVKVQRRVRTSTSDVYEERIC